MPKYYGIFLANMATIYPIGIDAGIQLPFIQNSDIIQPAVINNVRGAIIAVETELGVKPSGTYGTVRNRLDVVEILASSANFGDQTITAGGAVIAGSIISSSNITSLSIIDGKTIVNGISTSIVSDPGQGVIYFDSITNNFKVSENGSSYQRLTSPSSQFRTVGPANSLADYITDGINDEVQINNAVAEVSSSNAQGVVKLLPGTYTIENPIDLASGITLEGTGAGKTKVVVGLTFANTWNHSIGAIGSSTGPAVLLTANAVQGQTSIAVAQSSEFNNISFDDFVFLTSDAYWDDTINSGRKRGEFIKVVNKGVNRNGSGASITAYDATNKIITISTVSGFLSADVGSTITISGAATTNQNGTFPILSVNGPGTVITIFNRNSGLSGTDANNGSINWSGPSLTLYGVGARDQYLTSDNASIYRVNFVEDVEIKDIEMYQAAVDGYRDGAPPFIGLRLSRNCHLHNLKLHNNDGPGIVLESSLKTDISDCRIYNLWDFSALNSQYGYGILIGNASEEINITNCSLSRVRHGIDTGQWKGLSSGNTANAGIVRGVGVSNVTVAHATDAAFSTHTESEGISFKGCTASNCDNFGFFMRGKSVRIIGCTVEWCSGGISIGESSASIPSFIGDGSIVMGNSIRHIKNIIAGAASSRSTGSGGGTGGGNGIQLSRTDHVTIKNNSIEMCDRAGVSIRKRVYRCVIEGNTILDCNLNNSGASTGSAIVIDTPKTGTGSIAVSGITVTLTLSGNIQSASDVGALIKITTDGTTSAGNLGTFPILSVNTNGTQVTYTNASAVNGETCDWEEEAASYNLITKNLAANRPFIAGDPASSYERDITGNSQYLWRNSSTFAAHNMVINNVGINMTQTVAHGLTTDSSPTSIISGNTNNEANVMTISGSAITDGSFSSAPPIGSLAVDTVDNKLYFKVAAATWKSVTGT